MADFWLTRVRAGSRVERRLHMQVPSSRRNLMYIGIGTVVLIIIIVLVVLMLRRR